VGRNINTPGGGRFAAEKKGILEEGELAQKREGNRSIRGNHLKKRGKKEERAGNFKKGKKQGEIQAV